MATLEQGNWYLKDPSFAAVKSKFLTTVRHRTDGAELLLIIVIVSESLPFNDHPSPITGTGHARARNAVHHSRIIRRSKRSRQCSPSTATVSCGESLEHTINGEDDAALLPSFSLEPSAAGAEPAGLQPGEFVAASGFAERD